MTIRTARGYLQFNSTLDAGLCVAGFDLRTVPTWDRLLVESDDGVCDAVLVDMDDVERSQMSKQVGFSGHRLVSLLARQVQGRGVALVVITSLDYVEVEDLARLGVRPFLPPDVTPDACAEHIAAAIARSRRRAMHLVATPADIVANAPTVAAASSPEPTPALTH